MTPLSTGVAPLSATTLPELFLASAEAFADRPALDAGHTTLTYAELRTRAQDVARLLRARGVEDGDRVGIALAPGADVVIAVLGVLLARAVYVPLGTTYPVAHLKYMADDAGLTAVLVSGRDDLGGLPSGLPLLDIATVVAEGPPPAERCASSGVQPAYIIYTSGSTGRPKGVVVSHENVLAMLRATAERLDIRPTDRWSLFHSHNFDFSVWEMWGALAHGGCVIVVPPDLAADPGRFLEFLAARRVTVLSQVPSVFHYLGGALRRMPIRLELRYVVLGGESVRLDSVTAFLDAYVGSRPTVVNMYGITEATVHATFKTLDGDSLSDSARSPIGRPLPGTSVQLVREDGSPAEPGEVGEIFLSGAQVAIGYWERAELTAARFVERDLGEGIRRYYRTGDLAVAGPGGELEYVGRLDDQVKVRGFRIELGEIEVALRRHPAIDDAAVITCRNRLDELSLVAFIVSASGAPAPSRRDLRREVRRHLSAILPAHYLPSDMEAVEALPLTPSGKVDRNALRERARRLT